MKQSDCVLSNMTPDEIYKLAKVGRRAYDQARKDARREAQQRYWARQGLKLQGNASHVETDRHGRLQAQ